MADYYFVALCLIKQTGDDAEPGMRRVIVSAEVLTPPKTHMKARDDFDRRVSLAANLERFAESHSRG